MLDDRFSLLSEVGVQYNLDRFNPSKEHLRLMLIWGWSRLIITRLALTYFCDLLENKTRCAKAHHNL